MWRFWDACGAEMGIRGEWLRGGVWVAREEFAVGVEAVNVTVTKGETKRFRGRPGVRKDVKKAYVTLEEGNTIDVTTGL